MRLFIHSKKKETQIMRSQIQPFSDSYPGSSGSRLSKVAQTPLSPLGQMGYVSLQCLLGPPWGLLSVGMCL